MLDTASIRPLALAAALALPLAGAAAKTLVYCSEGSPENFTPALNTTGTTLRRRAPDLQPARRVRARHAPTSCPASPRSWDVSRRRQASTPSSCARASSSTPTRTASSRRATSTPTTCCSRSSGSGSDDHPYRQGHGRQPTPTSTTWACRTSLKSIEKVDDYTVKITLNEPKAPFLADLAMDFAVDPVEGICRRHAEGGHAREDRPGSRSAPARSSSSSYQKDAVIRYKAFPDYWGGKAEDRRPGLRDHARCRRCAGPSCRSRRMPGDGRIRTRPTSTR